MIQQFQFYVYPQKNRKQHLEELFVYSCNSNIIHNSQEVEEAKCPLMGDDKLWSIHAVEYYSASKRKEIRTRVTTWTNLDIMLNKINQSYRTNSV